MSEEMMAANADVQDISTSEGVAAPTETPASETPATHEGQGTQQDITQTQAFAHRLKQETEKAKAAERDALIAEMYGSTHGIRTYAEYQKAVDEANRQAEIDRLVQQNIPEDYAKEMMENRKFREQYESERKASEAKTQQEKQYMDFISAYPDIKPEQVPLEVWQMTEQGVSLLDAYVRYENKSLREQLNKFQTKEQAAAANQANAASSTGSVKTTGLPDSGYISKEVYEQNKGNQQWMMKNYDNLTKSMRKWGNQ